MANIEKNLYEIKKRIEEAALRSGRKPEEIELITVSKTVDVPRIKQAVDAGARLLGENRVQEILEKYDELSPYASFHLIGHLQKNKVKYIIGKVSLIHSVESKALAEEIDKRARQARIIQHILIEVNVSGEESKFGVKPDETAELVKSISEYENVRVDGLMTIAPFGAEEDELRRIFRGLKNIAGKIEALDIKNVSMKELSMGMTNDFELAVEEGATMVRVGTGIFGERNYA